MTIIVSHPSREKIDWWIEQLQALLPTWTIRPIHEPGDPAAVTYAVVWKPATGAFLPFPHLKAIVSLGAGIDHVLADAELPRQVPIIRTVGTDLTQRMREYVALHVLRHHRDMPTIAANQREKRWAQLVVPPATDRTVGVMGLGNLGGTAAATLATLGFETLGWSRTKREIAGVTTFSGEDEFPAFIERCEILVCLLPLTEATTGILNATLFDRLPEGASLINAGRGPHLVEDDLLAALESGRLGHATLDVFDIEPLPADHPFWTHPGVTVTPHIASLIDAPTGSRIVAANIERFEREGSVPDLADAGRGY
ncbi:2-hydroxyacid dehydrogenase [Salinicola rhizosphaerae]|uniref:Glyoxylate/hydroxypyruvate reductase A n=1 Tax=Salinicola rhizosphaerae TaxID=1443141 RepID=A0ABQ3DRN3_9GAMM|nr:glyoxylate/hydroxypyruvate reductase A [Salinicola rhizosphaerae]GHB12010.1 glyoxylate/hydroxypyruvate reductase A [Salinicola rhizosphaerae]